MITTKACILCFVLLTTCSGIAPVCHGTDITAVRPDTTVVPRYGKFEVEFDLSGTYSNPFDPDEVDACLCVIPPSGDTLTIPAFWYQGYERSNTGTDEILTEAGAAVWMARFGPSQTGRYAYFIEVTDSAGYVRSEDSTFICNASTSRGFVRPAPSDDRLFAFDDGCYYMPNGQNVSWATNLGTYDYDMYFDEMETAGENWARIWMTHFYRGQSLEWNEDHWTGYFHGLGVYSLECAWKIDYIVELARAKGIYIQLVTQHHGQFSTAVNPEWEENPYNTANGGMLSSPEQFFTNTAARDLYRRKMRYTVARWGYSTSILCWEFWNEVQYTDNYSPTTVAAWHAEVGEYVRSIDTARHMLTTSARQGDTVIWTLPEIDCTQIHLYIGEITNTIRNKIVSMWTHDKPVIVGEFGYYPHETGWADTDGTHIHNGIWSAAMTMTGAMPWWWDNYIHPEDLYYHWGGLSSFFEGEDLRYPTLDTVHVDVYDSTGVPTATARGYAMGDSICAYLWLQDPGNTIGNTPEDTLSGISIEIGNMAHGDYDIEHWNTFLGTMISDDIITCSNDSLEIAVPDFSLDIAIKVKRQDEAGTASPGLLDPTAVRSLRVSPNPVHHSTVICMEPACDVQIEFSVYDVAGRLMWKSTSVGGTPVEWDGRNMDGNGLPSGIYICKAVAHSREYTGKIVILR